MGAAAADLGRDPAGRLPKLEGPGGYGEQVHNWEAGFAAECPEVHLLIRAAQYLGCPPWELAQQNPLWVRVALADRNAVTQAENLRRKG